MPRYIHWAAEFQGPRISLVEADTPLFAAALATGRDEEDILEEGFDQDKDAPDEWGHGDCTVLRIDTDDQLHRVALEYLDNWLSLLDPPADSDGTIVVWSHVFGASAGYGPDAIGWDGNMSDTPVATFPLSGRDAAADLMLQMAIARNR